MRKLLFILLMALLSSCYKNVNVVDEKNDFKNICNTLGEFLDYYYRNIKLDQEYVALDTQGKPLQKEEFLKLLQTGNYIPLLSSNNSNPSYRLYKINPKKLSDISAVMRQFASYSYQYYKMEGKTLGDFSFTDINGKTYTSNNTKGKFLVLKTWFIGCHQCIWEMPQLNKLVTKYKNNGNVIFLSLALDDEKSLREFLLKHKFSYAIVSNSESFMNKWKLNIYPTHILVDKGGKISKVLNHAEGLEMALSKEIFK